MVKITTAHQRYRAVYAVAAFVDGEWIFPTRRSAQAPSAPNVARSLTFAKRFAEDIQSLYDLTPAEVVIWRIEPMGEASLETVRFPFDALKATTTTTPTTTEGVNL